MKQPRTPWTSTQVMKERQKASPLGPTTQGCCEIRQVAVVVSQLSCGQSESLTQVQKPWPFPSSATQYGAQTMSPDGPFTHCESDGQPALHLMFEGVHCEAPLQGFWVRMMTSSHS